MAVSAALVEDDNGVATMKSEETHELLEGFHDSELQLAGSAAVERHLCTCPFFCLATFNRHKTLRTRVRKAWPRARFASLECSGPWREENREPTCILPVRARWRRAIYQ